MEKGVIGFDNIEIPATFSEELFPADRKFGVMGVAAKTDIAHR